MKEDFHCLGQGASIALAKFIQMASHGALVVNFFVWLRRGIRGPRPDSRLWASGWHDLVHFSWLQATSEERSEGLASRCCWVHDCSYVEVPDSVVGNPSSQKRSIQPYAELVYSVIKTTRCTTNNSWDHEQKLTFLWHRNTDDGCGQRV